MGHAEPAGFEPLPRAIAVYLALHRGDACDPEQVIIIPGAHAAFMVAAQLLTNPGDGPPFEDPGPFIARHLFASLGRRLVHVPVDADGIAFEAAVAADREVRLASVMPSRQHPLGLQAKLLAALAETLPITVFGLALGMAFAFALALTSRLTPSFTRLFMPVALVTETMPLVALTPLLVLLLGRGTAVTLWITVSVTFFPAYVLMAQGLALVPRATLELPRAYGASALAELRLVAIPASSPWIFAALRLAAPRALLGVMIAEWLATDRGLGNLLNQSRGYLDIAMIWTVAAVSVLISVAFYQLVSVG